MLTYRYNLLGLGYSTRQYKNVASRALVVARGASAVDTGAFRKGWTTRVVGDFLLVSNSVRYSAPVELGSIVHKKHQFKVRDALAGMGLGQGAIVLSTGASAVFDTPIVPTEGPRSTPTQEEDNQAGSSLPSNPPSQRGLPATPSLEELRSASRQGKFDQVRELKRRVLQSTNKANAVPSLLLRSPVPSKGKLMNKIFLLGLLEEQQRRKQEELNAKSAESTQ